MSTASSSQLRRKSECGGVQMDFDILGLGHRPIFWSGKFLREGVKHTEYKYRNQKGCIRGIWVPQLPSYWEKLQHGEQDQCAGGGSGSSC